MSNFIQSTSGRLMSLSISLALIGGGASAFMEQTSSLYVMAFSVFVAIVGCIASLELSIDEHPQLTVLAIIGLPVFLFLYMVALGFVMSVYAAGGYAFIGLGVGALAIFVRSLAVTKAEPSVALSRPAHATHR